MMLWAVGDYYYFCIGYVFDRVRNLCPEMGQVKIAAIINASFKIYTYLICP